MDLINLNQHLAVIKVTGSDSVKYLQGQVTNDINHLNSTLNNNCLMHQFAAHLNHKGRMLANFIIIKPETDKFYLLTNRELIPELLPRIKMFILRSKVEITSIEKNLILAPAPIANEINIELAPKAFVVISDNNYTATNNLDEWNEFLVANAITLIHKETVEKLIPQQANLDDLQAISYTKGCYTGQEIVARTHYLGKIKRKLFCFAMPTNFKPSIGQRVISPKMANQEVGIIVEIAPNYGLVSAQTDCIDALFLDTANTIKLNIID